MWLFYTSPLFSSGMIPFEPGKLVFIPPLRSYPIEGGCSHPAPHLNLLKNKAGSVRALGCEKELFYRQKDMY